MSDKDLLKLAILNFYIAAKQKNVQIQDKFLLKNCINDSKKILEKINIILNESSSTDNTDNTDNENN